MKTYPSISHNINYDIPITAFDKPDGSNIRAEWTPKKGFYKFGSRRCMIDQNDPLLGDAVDLIKSHESYFSEKFTDHKNFVTLPRSVICFFEYYGPNSFAGQHDSQDKKIVTLIDVNVHKQAIMGPSRFIKLFSALIPKVIYVGKVTESFVQDVRNSNLPGISCEGVVCKTEPKKGHNPIMFKIKTYRWLRMLKEYCGNDEVMYERLV